MDYLFTSLAIASPRMHVSIPEFDAELPIDSTFLIQTSPPSSRPSRMWSAPLHVTIVLHLVAAYLVILFGNPSYNHVMSWGRAILFAQVILVGIWLVQGTAPLNFRILGALAALTVCWVDESLSGWERDFTGLAMAQMVCVAGPLLLLRSLGWQFREEAEALDSVRWRFGIRHLLMWTIGAAMLLSLVRWCAAWLEMLMTTEFATSGALAAVALATTYAVMGSGQVAARCALLGAALAGASIVSFSRFAADVVVMILVSPMAIVALTLWTARVGGYRLRHGAVADAGCCRP